MYLRIYTPDGLVLSEVPDVAGKPRVTDSGALVVPLSDGGRYVVNPNAWTDLTEHPDPPGPLPEWLQNSITRRSARATFRAGIARQVPMVPGRPPEPPAPAAADDDTRVNPFPAVTDEVPDSGPLSIVCICDELRCPVIIDPAPDHERKWWKLRQRSQDGSRVNGSPIASGPQPLMRCSFHVGHGGEHKWVPATDTAPPGWPFGPNMHHDECPRHPLNQRGPEGQPVGRHAADRAGITGATDDTPADPTATLTGLAPISLVRPTPDTDPESWLSDLKAVAGNSGPGGNMPTRPSHNPDAQAEGMCGRWAPPYDHDPAQPDRWCQLLAGHKGDRHMTEQSSAGQGRERLVWSDAAQRGEVAG